MTPLEALNPLNSNRDSFIVTKLRLSLSLLQNYTNYLTDKGFWGILKPSDPIVVVVVLNLQYV